MNFAEKCKTFLALTVFTAPMLGCASAPPKYDVPTDSRNVPSTKSIVQRIECELIELVRDDVAVQYEHRPTLLLYDYEVSMLLSLGVNDAGSLTPSFNFPSGNFAFNVAAEFSQSREDDLNISLFYSMRDLAKNWRAKRLAAACPEIETNLAGDLGLRRSITAALETNDLKLKTNVAPDEVDPAGGEFSGSINFTVTKNLNNVGPTWTLKHFVGPGNLASLSEVNTDKLTFGFAEGKNAGKPLEKNSTKFVYTRSDNRSSNALSRQILTDVGTQLTLIQNTVRRF